MKEKYPHFYTVDEQGNQAYVIGSKENQIERIKEYLQSTDDAVIKYASGRWSHTEEEYLSQELKRGHARIDIRELQNWDAETDTVTDSIEIARSRKLLELDMYDKSSAVNTFYYQDTPLWLPISTRNNLLNNSIPSCIASGDSTIYITIGDLALTMEIEALKGMVLAVEYYAKLAFDTTSKHRIAINKLTTIEDIEAYDFTVGYPKKLRL